MEWITKNQERTFTYIRKGQRNCLDYSNWYDYYPSGHYYFHTGTCITLGSIWITQILFYEIYEFLYSGSEFLVIITRIIGYKKISQMNCF